MKMKMVKRLTAALLAVTTVASLLPVHAVYEPGQGTLGGIVSQAGTLSKESTASVSITASAGYQEGAYVQWSAVTGATGYNVYCDGVQLDTMLVRQYASYFRADAVGITAGAHTIKVVPVIGGAADTSKAAEVQVTAEAHDREGFAFQNGKDLGAYNADGTLKSGAVVVYVTNANKDSVSASIGGSTVTGVQNIITACKNSSVPVCIRFIGNITDPSTLDQGDILVDKAACGLTLEGIGNDTTLNGFGIRIKNSSDVEIRNFGLMNCDSKEGDSVSLQQSNTYCWVHHCDFFYGAPGSDADQIKGDGALDTKKSQYITHSYNHFWDSGKTHLNGNGDTELNYITYHHNWYDHSDSRHPLVRVSSAVHMYNNYYDGISKYGMIARLGSSIFAEGNYFKDTQDPMLISQQGTDIADGDAISSDEGGMIKSYGNAYDNTTAPITHKDNSTSFDCYEASSPTEQVPGSYVTVSGGTAYSNFDTASSMYSYTADAAADVPAIVQAKAGRVTGSDFTWDFSDPAEDTNYDVISGLRTALTAYSDSIVAIGSGFTDSTTTPDTTEPAQTTAPAATTAPSGTTAPVTAGDYVHNFTENGTSSTFYTISGNLSTSKGTVSYNGLTLTQCLKLESATSITFSGSGTLTLVLAEAGKRVKIDGTNYTSDASGIVTAELAAGSHTIAKGDSANLFYMVFSGEGSAPGTTASSETAAPEQTTTQTTTIPTSPEDSITGDLKLVSVGGWNEIAYMVITGVTDSGVTAVSYSGPTSGSLTGQDFEYLVRDVSNGVRVDIPGLQPGTYSVTMETAAGTVTKGGIVVGAQDRSGYAHYNYTAGVGAYNDNGTLKDNAVVLYVTESNKNSVSVTSKDGTTVTGIGNILNSSGQDVGGGLTSKDGKANTNSDIIEKLAKDGTPLVIRIIGSVSAPDGLTAYDSVDYGGSVGDNGYMARMQSGKDITIEGMGTDATIDGWGIHFIAESANTDLGKSFEVRNIHFRNVPEDCIGMEGVQGDSALTAPVERCWIHNCEFYAPSVANPAESDKDGGDGACDFKRGMYFTNSYCYYEGYHKTNLVGASDNNLQYHITYHNNYWKDCESRGPLARTANIHMYNNVFDGQTSYCMNPRANAYIFSEYNLFLDSKDVMEVESGGVVKSFNDTFTNCRGNAQGVIVSSRDEAVSNSNTYGDFETNAALSYIPSGDYELETDTSKLQSQFEADGGCMDEDSYTGGDAVITPTETTTSEETTTNETTTTTTTTTTETTDSEGDAATMYDDVNVDGKVTIVDVIMLNKCLMGADSMTPVGSLNADVTKDGSRTADDSLMILKSLVKLLTLPNV